MPHKDAMIRQVEQDGKLFARIPVLGEDIQMWFVNGDRFIGEGNAEFFNPDNESHHPVAIIRTEFRHVHFRHQIVDIQNDLCPQQLWNECRKNQKIWSRVDLHNVVGSSKVEERHLQKGETEKAEIGSQMPCTFYAAIFAGSGIQPYAAKTRRLRFIETDAIDSISPSAQSLSLAPPSWRAGILATHDHAYMRTHLPQVLRL